MKPFPSKAARVVALVLRMALGALFIVSAIAKLIGIDRFEACGVYHVTAEDVLSDADAASFACSIRDDAGQEVAKANLNAYRPPDMTEFLKEQMKA